MKKFAIIFLVIMLIFIFSSKSFAVIYGNVKDNNDGTSGQILVNTGINSGSSDIGHWTDPTTISELKGADGVNGTNGIDGRNGQSIKGDTGKGLRDGQEAQIEVRILDTRKTTTSLYFIRDFRNDNNTVGVKFVYKIGQSYTDKKIAELEEKINQLTKY